MIQNFTLEQKEYIKEIAYKNGFSKTETLVFEGVLTGKKTKDVAESLFIAEKTAKFHLINIFKKTQIKRRVELVWLLNLIWPNKTEAEALRTDLPY